MMGVPMLPTAAVRRPHGLQDRREHLGGGGLAVRTGDGEPGRRFPAGLTGGLAGPRGAQFLADLAEQPGDLDVAHDVHAGRGGGREQRAVGLPAGRGDDQLGALGEGLGVAEAYGDPQLAQFGGAGTVALAVTAVDDGHDGAEAGQGAGGTDAAHAETGHGDVPALPGGHLSAAHPA